MYVTGEVRATETEKVIFGKPAAEALVGEVERLGTKRAFLMVSGSLRRETDKIEMMEAALGNTCVGIFDAMPAHSPREAVIAAAAQARGADADLIVTYGGGSLTDGAKVVQICLKHNLTQVSDLDNFHIRTTSDGQIEIPTFDAPDVRQISIPTTLSGGEFNPHAGCTNSQRKIKQGYRHPKLAPISIILDPASTTATPEWLWLSTGMRAVDHAVESFCSLQCNPYHEGFSLQALRLLYSGLKASKQNPDDLEARLNCQIGSWLSMAGVTSGVPMGASHGIGHILGGTCDVPHGYTSCIMLPQVLRYNEGTNRDRQALLSIALDNPDKSAADLIQSLVAELGLPQKLSDVGVSMDQFELIAKNSMHDRWIHTNPKKIDGPNQIMEILNMAA